MVRDALFALWVGAMMSATLIGAVVLAKDWATATEARPPAVDVIGSAG